MRRARRRASEDSEGKKDGKYQSHGKNGVIKK